MSAPNKEEVDAFGFFKKKTTLDLVSKSVSSKQPVDFEITQIDKDDEVYNMHNYKRGHAYIFNHYEFDIHPKREGTHKDCEDIEEVLKQLKFEVEVYNDLKYGQIYDVLDEVANMDHSEADCFLIVVMSHGDNGVIYARDHTYPPDMLWNSFTGDKCPSLAGKPKLFFIQACRGEEVDSGVQIRSRNTIQSDLIEDTYKIPVMADILVMYSTYPGYFSFRSVSNGSWFIQCLCEELKSKARTNDLVTILTYVNRRVAIGFESFIPTEKNLHEKKQIGVIVSTLTRLLYFFSDN